jgi:hypothetical protein
MIVARFPVYPETHFAVPLASGSIEVHLYWSLEEVEGHSFRQMKSAAAAEEDMSSQVVSSNEAEPYLSGNHHHRCEAPQPEHRESSGHHHEAGSHLAIPLNALYVQDLASPMAQSPLGISHFDCQTLCLLECSKHHNAGKKICIGIKQLKLTSGLRFALHSREDIRRWYRGCELD